MLHIIFQTIVLCLGSNRIYAIDAEEILKKHQPNVIKEKEYVQFPDYKIIDYYQCGQSIMKHEKVNIK